MKINPIYRQETKVSARSFRLPLIILVCNSVLALAALLDMFSMVSQVRVTAEIQYSSFLSLYFFAAAIEFMMLLLIVPALTSGSISGERERQTLNLLLTTRMTPADIVFGKLLASLSTVFLLIISSFPILSLVFIYGGITAVDIGVLLLCFSSTALLAGCVGICCSSVFKRSAIATAASYCVMMFLVFGTVALFRFVESLEAVSGDALSEESRFAWILLVNPAVSFATAMRNQTGSSQRIPIVDAWAGKTVSGSWLWISLVVQVCLAVGCLWAAVRQVNPRKRKR